ncbi:MAG TPA: hypothetical protein VM223_08975, partial [Planctomycetota bacterium]|nr:hypothetical protein [Planctomycetota bacterium]
GINTKSSKTVPREYAQWIEMRADQRREENRKDRRNVIKVQEMIPHTITASFSILSQSSGRRAPLGTKSIKDLSLPTTVRLRSLRFGVSSFGAPSYAACLAFWISNRSDAGKPIFRHHDQMRM